ncbi:MAG: tail fiber domain-containing protein [Patescibacteria group bacterium]
MDEKLSILNNKILSQIVDLKNQLASKTQENFQAIALTNKIDNLHKPTISEPSISGVSTFSGAISGTTATFSGNLTSGGLLSVTGSGTSTISGNLAISGSIDIGGVCINCGSGGGFSGGSLSATSIINTGNTTLGDATTTDIIYVNSRFAGSLVPTVDNSLDVGDGTNWLRFRTGYFGTSLGIGGTATSTGTNLLASGAYAIDSGGTLSLNTTNNQNIITGTGKFGIGTSTPYATFTVWGAGTTTSRALEIADNASTTLLTVLDNGNVGIATSSPYAKLSVSGEIVAAYFTATTSAASQLPYASSTAITVSGTASTTDLVVSNISTFKDFTATNSTTTNATTTNLAVLATASSTDLIISGNATLSKMTPGSVIFSSTGGLLSQNNANFSWNDSATRLSFPYASSTSLTTSGGAWFATNGGNVGVGTTSPFAKLSVAGSGFFNDALTASNITATGTLNALGLSTLTGGFISNASSSIGGPLTVSGTLNASSTIVVGNSAFTRISGDNLASTIPYASSTSLTTSGGAWFGTNGGSVGIGTTSPWGILSIQGTAGQTAPLFIIATSSAATNPIFAIDSSGNVNMRGILNASSTSFFSGDSLFNGNILIGSTGTTTHLATTIQNHALQIQGGFSADGDLEALNTFYVKPRTASYAGASFDTAASGNTDPRGITQYGGFFWMVDRAGAQVYKYTTTGTYTGVSFDTAASGNTSPRGIAQYGGFFWITDDLSDGVYKYTGDGTYTGISFDTAGSWGNTNPSGIIQYGGFFWVTDESDDEVYKYTTDGTYTGISFDTAGSGNVNTRQITQYGGFFWVIGYVTNRAYKYTTDGTYTGVFFDTSGSGNGNPVGITQYGGFFWITDDSDDEVYKYGISTDTYTTGLTAATSTAQFGVGTTTPWGLLSINPNALGAGVPSFVIGSSTATSLIVTNGGNVGIGTTNPLSTLQIGAGTGTYLPTATPKTIIWDTSNTTANGGNVAIVASNLTATGIDLGGSLSFGGVNNSNGNFTDFASIAGRREDSVDGNAPGYLSLSTRVSAGAMTERMRISSTGNVGIGMANPTDNLQLEDTNAYTAGLKISYSSSYYSRIGYNEASNKLKFSGKDGTSESDRMTIDMTNGNVGIGTIAPQTTLGIQSTGAVRQGINAHLEVTDNTAFAAGVGGGIAFSGQYRTPTSNTDYVPYGLIKGYKLNATSADYSGGLQFYTVTSGGNLTQKMAIDNSGNVGIGTTTPVTKLHISGEAETLRLSGVSTGANNIAYLTFHDVNNVRKGFIGDGAASNSDIYLISDAGNIIIAGTGGNCTFTGAASGGTCFSDARLKNITGDVTDVLDKFAQLQLKNFYWNDTAHALYNTSTTIENTGFVAQSVEQIFPELIETNSDGYKSLNYARLGLYSMEAIKELNAKVDVIKAVIDTSSASTTVPSMFIDANGNVGIGTTTPVYKLHIAGDVAATGFVNVSTREAKKDITYLNDSDEESALAKITSTNIATYIYISETYVDGTDATGEVNSAGIPRRLGLIAEEAPVEILSPDHKGVDLYKMTAFLWSGVKAQQKQIEVLALKVADIEAKVAAMSNEGRTTDAGGASVSSALSISDIATFFNSMGASISSGMIQATEFIANKITAKKVTTDALEMKDSVTGEVYCVRISGGEWNKFKGTCGEFIAEPAPATVVEPVLEPAPTDTATSTTTADTSTTQTSATETATTTPVTDVATTTSTP